MILLVDVGNTRIKWRYLNALYIKIDSGEMNNDLVSRSSLIGSFKSYDIQALYLSCVGQRGVLDCIKEYSEWQKIKLNIIEAQKNMCGVTFAYEEIGRLGIDRCLAMIGAFEGSGILVVDAGSAITADYIDDRGRHIGGYIVPGYEMCRTVLLGKTAKIGVMADLGSLEPGANTDACVNNGFAVMYSALLEGFIKSARDFGIARFVVTGGDGVMIASLSAEVIECHENLVLDGLQKYSLQFERESGVLL